MSKQVEAALFEQLDRLSEISVRCQESPDYRRWIENIQLLRRDRILQTYSDLLQQRRYRQAVTFLANDLYGCNGLSQRGKQLRKASSTMVKVLPESLLATVVKVIEFTGLLMRLDLQLAEVMSASFPDLQAVEIGSMREATKLTDERAWYDQQIRLVLAVGMEIEEVVHRPFISTALKMCRGPARMLGLSNLQEYLERGFAAFKAMQSASEFFQIFETRETDLLDDIFS